MQSISLWDDVIGNQTMIVCDDDFPLNEVILPSNSLPPPVFPVPRSSLAARFPRSQQACRGCCFPGSASPNPKAQ